ncbi:hypothetical protein GQ44DRAFT_617151 [Phaeosphaeriaceae sp. PMI808]|nr:hypothetical protein GQ44DRAFT_617151 [Phaeosphaeriaceae sp. PMI808]
MTTFHPFSRLPVEIRFQIWELAEIKDRVLKVRKVKRRLLLEPYFPAYWSPTCVLSVTRACQESRKYSSYQKAFIVEGLPRYIWANFERGILQMLSSYMNDLVSRTSLEGEGARHLRIELLRPDGRDDSEDFYHEHCNRICEFPGMPFTHLILPKGITDSFPCTTLIDGIYFGSCPKSNIRIINAKTGEWIDEETSGPYQLH